MPSPRRRIACAFLLALALPPATLAQSIQQGSLSCGTVERAELRFPGETHSWTLNAGPEDLLNIAVGAVDGELLPLWTIFDSAGEKIMMGPRRADGVAITPEFGNYTLVVEDMSGEATGAYALQAQWLSTGGSCAGRLTCGVAEIGRIDHGVQHDTYAFIGGEGDVVEIAATSLRWVDPVWTLIGPDGAVVDGVRHRRHLLTLPTTGSYTLLLEDRELEYTGDYLLSLHGVSQSSACGSRLAQLHPARIELRNPGERAAFVIGGRRDELVRLSVSSAGEVDGVDVRWTLYGPEGRPLTREAGMEPNEVRLAGNGNHTVIVEGAPQDPTGRAQIVADWLSRGD